MVTSLRQRASTGELERTVMPAAVAVSLLCSSAPIMFSRSRDRLFDQLAADYLLVARTNSRRAVRKAASHL